MALSEEDKQEIRQIMQEELFSFREKELDFNKTDRFTFEKLIQLLDGRNLQLGKTTGSKIGTATDQKLAFFNSTPIIQQTTSSQTAATFAANTSGISDDTATWDGYTVGDIVAILQAFGLIA